MTAKDKAEELVNKMEKNFMYFASREIAIQHALIAVDEILKLHKKIALETLEFYQEVKSEIEKL